MPKVDSTQDSTHKDGQAKGQPAKKAPTRAEPRAEPRAGPKAAAATKAKAPGTKAESTQVDSAPRRKLLYPDIVINRCWQGQGAKGAIKAHKAKELLGWETEDQFVQRLAAQGVSEEDARARFERVYMFQDVLGNRVVCWNIEFNRPLDESHVKKLCQSALKMQWAGPTAMPGETVNGDTIAIGRTGLVIQGQHRLIAIVFAWQMWHKSPYWREVSQSEPVIETIVVFGISESPAVAMTIDCTKPRSLADTIYTSEIFRKLSPKERRECSASLGKAVDLLWKRTGVSQMDEHSKYQTHTESHDLLSRHPRLLECLRLTHECNKPSPEYRPLNSIKLSVGQCATLLYLMGCSASDEVDYRQAEPRPNEAALNWDNWDRAVQFWMAMGKRQHSPLGAVREAIRNLLDVDSGAGGRQIEKHAVIAKAWPHWLEGHDITREDVELTADNYVTSDRGQDQLVGQFDFGGIDRGEGKPEPESIPGPEELSKRIKEVREQSAQQALAKAQAQEEEEEQEEEEQEEEAPAKAKAPKPMTRKQVQAANTEKARKADAELARKKG